MTHTPSDFPHPARLYYARSMHGDMRRLKRERIVDLAYRAFIVLALLICAIALFTNPSDWGLK